jgi:trk system potassium uptake protein TrkH
MIKRVGDIATRGSSYARLIFLIGCLLAAPLCVLPFFGSETKYMGAFLIPSAVSVGLSIIIFAVAPQKETETVTEWQAPIARGSLPVLFAWCYAFIMGAIPFVIAGQMNMQHALFESVSGWTTTGLTVADVENLPRIFQFHRSFMQFCGGLGFIIMIEMLVQSRQAMNLFMAEGHNDRLMPSLRRTARAIFSLYTCFLILGVGAYIICGMESFDAVCHAMSALSTAGFSTKAGSIGAYGSPAIELTTVVLMLVGATNFAALLLAVKRRWRQFARISELRFMICMIVILVPLCAVALSAANGMNMAESVVEALFGVVTMFTTTGYATMNYAAWPPFALGLLFLLMIVGGCMGSTAGGIKLTRVNLMLRTVWANIRKSLSPNRKITLLSYYTPQGKMPIDDTLVRDTFCFITVYVVIMIVGSLALTITAGCSVFDAMFEFASALGTVGVSNGLTNPNTNVPTLVVEMIGMILGRLEVFIVFIGMYAGLRALKEAAALHARSAK